jgi:hypothetical protein
MICGRLIELASPRDRLIFLAHLTQTGDRAIRNSDSLESIVTAVNAFLSQLSGQCRLDSPKLSTNSILDGLMHCTLGTVAEFSKLRRYPGHGRR